MRMNQERVTTIPNIISALRILLGPALLVIAWRGHHNLFLGVLITSFLLDLVDGPIARATNQVTEIGPKLDSWADFSIYMTLPIGAWWLWPEIIIREQVYVGIAVASVIVPTIVGLIKFKQPTSYHTWLVKFAVVCISISVILLLLGGPAWPFRISAIIAMLAGIEEILITLLTKTPLSDAKSIFHVLDRQNADRDN